MAGKKKPTKKSNANTTGAAKKAPARTEKAGKQKPGSQKANSQPRKKADGLGRKERSLSLSEAAYQHIVDAEEEPGASQKLLETIIDAAPI